MKTFYDIIKDVSNLRWSIVDPEPSSFAEVQKAVKLAVAQAHNFIWNLDDFPFKNKKDAIAVDAGVSAVLAPKGNISKVWIAGGDVLKPIKSEDADLLETKTGTPQYYWVDFTDSGAAINVYPIPDKKLTLMVRYISNYKAKSQSGELKFNLEDMLIQLRQIQSLGDIKGIMMMIPGMNKFREKIENANIDNKVFKRQEAIILSMTPRERKNPDIIKASRKQRIANGSGVSVNDVNRLLKQYEQMALASKKFKKMGPLGAMRMMKQMSSAMRSGNSNNPFMNNGGGFPPF